MTKNRDGMPIVERLMTALLAVQWAQWGDTGIGVKCAVCGRGQLSNPRDVHTDECLVGSALKAGSAWLRSADQQPEPTTESAERTEEPTLQERLRQLNCVSGTPMPQCPQCGIHGSITWLSNHSCPPGIPVLARVKALEQENAKLRVLACRRIEQAEAAEAQVKALEAERDACVAEDGDLAWMRKRAEAAEAQRDALQAERDLEAERGAAVFMALDGHWDLLARLPDSALFQHAQKTRKRLEAAEAEVFELGRDSMEQVAEMAKRTSELRAEVAALRESQTFVALSTQAAASFKGGAQSRDQEVAALQSRLSEAIALLREARPPSSTPMIVAAWDARVDELTKEPKP